jgi:hypothetical protein
MANRRRSSSPSLRREERHDRSHKRPDLDPRAEFHTILAALRSYQERGLGEFANSSAEIYELASSGGKVNPLNSDAIDRFCEGINTTAR